MCVKFLYSHSPADATTGTVQPSYLDPYAYAGGLKWLASLVSCRLKYYGGLRLCRSVPDCVVILPRVSIK